MRADHLSLTTFMSAFIRAHHATHDVSPIFHDVLAPRILPPERYALIAQALAMSLRMKDLARRRVSRRGDGRRMDGAVHVRCRDGARRARYAEDTVAAAVDQGIRQYVVLGWIPLPFD